MLRLVAAQQAVSNLQAMYGTINIAGIHDGFFDEAEEQRIINDIKTSGAKLVFVALGVPKQEQWISKKLSSLQGVVAIGIEGLLMYCRKYSTCTSLDATQSFRMVI